MGQSLSQSSRSPISSSCKPNPSLDDVFFYSVNEIRENVFSMFSFSSSSASWTVPELEREKLERVKKVTRVYWCSEPLNELGQLKVLSPRSLPRWLAMRASRELEGPASWELGHSFALVDVELSPEAEEGRSFERYRLNWGAGRHHNMNLLIERQERVPSRQLTGERLEKDLLQRWDGQPYDANAANNRNCHHFVQELIHTCTRHAGHEDTDRPA
ncbi:unnamed protein product [Effrenium voratum]|uniref:Uncharacterized protein n=1 Tax=Effrenium voratum TaxID=2562239 RepID=A0AA36NB52_9DINO|nr:unnamed protein product [Effrenium voratum]